MKFEYAYGQEVDAQETQFASVAPPILFTSFGDRACTVSQRKRTSWNFACFVSEGSHSSSMCTGFALASRTLYSDELSRLVHNFPDFTSQVSWPNLQTVDRHYFAQILRGVIRSAIPEVEDAILINPDEFYGGLHYPFFELIVRRLEIGYSSRKYRKVDWGTDVYRALIHDYGFSKTQ
jgi:hypothetical protein